MPVFVLTHHEREPLTLSDTTFTFVTDGIESALEQARAAAGDKDVTIGGGADVINQYLAAGLVDELELHVAPLLLGGGARLFEGVGPDPRARADPRDRGARRDAREVPRRLADELHVGELLLVFVLAVLWSWPLVILHELGHALAALLLTDGRVIVGVGGHRDQLVLTAGRVELGLSPAIAPGGECMLDEGGLRMPKAEAWIAAAGPFASLCAGVVLLAAALNYGGIVLATGAGVAWLQAVLTAVPIRYGAGIGPGESDGRAIWRVVTGGPPGGPAREERRLGRPERAVRPWFVAVLALVAVLTALVEPLLLLVLAGLFGVAWLLQK